MLLPWQVWGALTCIYIVTVTYLCASVHFKRCAMLCLARYNSVTFCLPSTKDPGFSSLQYSNVCIKSPCKWKAAAHSKEKSHIPLCEYFTERPIEKSKIPPAFCWRRQKTKLLLSTETGISSNTTLYLSDSQIPFDVLLKGTLHCRYWIERHRISTLTAVLWCSQIRSIIYILGNYSQPAGYGKMFSGAM